MKLSKVGPGVHRRPAARTPGSTPRSPTSGSTPTSGCSRRRCRTGSPSARRTSAGGTSTARRWSGCRRTASRTRPGSRSARSTRRRNPYLAFAVLLGAGLKGIEEGYELPPGAEDDVWSLSNAERRAMGYEALPENLAEAIDVMAGSRTGRRGARRARLRLLPAQQAGRVGGVPPRGHPVRAAALPVALAARADVVDRCRYRLDHRAGAPAGRRPGGRRVLEDLLSGAWQRRVRSRRRGVDRAGFVLVRPAHAGPAKPGTDPAACRLAPASGRRLPISGPHHR